MEVEDAVSPPVAGPVHSDTLHGDWARRRQSGQRQQQQPRKRPLRTGTGSVVVAAAAEPGAGRDALISMSVDGYCW